MATPLNKTGRRKVVRRLCEHDELRADSGYHLAPEAAEQFSARVREARQKEAQAFSDWELGVRDLASSITNEQLAALREDLGMWLHTIITRHRIEAALLLYPEQERAEAFVDRPG